MANQVLAFHRVSDRVYDLTGMRTGSVRDQLLRSTLTAVALHDEGLIDDSTGGRLLVFGAGAAGMNLALSAAKRGVNVIVIEREAGPFTSLLKATTRRIDPVEFDWPHTHFRNGKFPATGSTIPLMQISGTGDDLAFDWTKAWNHWRTHLNGVHGRGTVQIQQNSDARSFAVTDSGRSGAVEVAGPFQLIPGPTEKFGAVVSCIGFSGEITSDDYNLIDRWNGYHGPTFWLDDDTLTPAAPAPLIVKHVVISGGGDGGMQDFQRALTGKFGKALLDVIAHEANVVLPGWNPTPSNALLAFALAEEAGRRAYAWQREKQPIQQSLADWHDEYAREVRKLFWPLSQKMINALANAVLRPEVLDGRLQVRWLYRTPTPGYAYALNRYLSLLLEKLMAAASGCTSRVYPGREIVKMTPVGHTCSHPGLCVGQAHELVIANGDGTTTFIPDADLVIVRHGARPQRVFGGAAVREQMTPFDFPL